MAITITISLDKMTASVFKYAAVIQATRSTRVEPNSHNTLLRVKRPGSEIPGQVYGYRTSQEGVVSGHELDHGREGTLYGSSGKGSRNLPRSVRSESPHTPRHSRATDRRDRQIGKTRQLHGE